MKKIMIALGLFVATNIHAQDKVETTVAADIVNQYIWRGQDLGNVSLQPTLGVAYKGFSLSAWGSVGLTDAKDTKEFDLTLFSYLRATMSHVLQYLERMVYQFVALISVDIYHHSHTTRIVFVFRLVKSLSCFLFHIYIFLPFISSISQFSIMPQKSFPVGQMPLSECSLHLQDQSRCLVYIPRVLHIAFPQRIAMNHFR